MPSPSTDYKDANGTVTSSVTELPPAAIPAPCVAERPVDPKLKQGQLTDWNSVKEFIFAGNAVFTLRSAKTGVRITYRVKAKKADLKEKARHITAGETVEEGFTTYFVTILRGPDNTHDFAYLGVLREPGLFFTTPRSQAGSHATAWKALVWFLGAMKGGRAVLGGHPLEFWHAGRCAKCSRLLTVPESVECGIGPECRKRA